MYQQLKHKQTIPQTPPPKYRNPKKLKENKVAWIDAAKAKPKAFKSVLVWVIQMEGFAELHPYCDIACLNRENQWIVNSFEREARTVTVTHWSPLLQAPHLYPTEE